MRVTVKLFAIAREKAGTGEVLLDVPDGADVAMAARTLAERLPALAGGLDRVAYAVNCEYASMKTMLKEGDELAVIPPVSGG